MENPNLISKNPTESMIDSNLIEVEQVSYREILD